MRPLIKKHILTIIVITLLLCIVIDTRDLFSNTLYKTKKTIVIDPGHGGDDKGVKGPDHSFEKDITFALAKKIKSQLEEKYNVVLTRNGDYWIDIHSRTEVANKNEADLFISIHTGGSFVHETSGINILYYTPQPDSPTTAATHITTPGIANENTNDEDWFNAQKKYSPISRVFAKFLLEQFSKTPGYTSTRISGLPALVLSGANRPAIIIEAGYSTNPSEEKLLLNSNYISEFARKISTGIDDFLRKYTGSY